MRETIPERTRMTESQKFVTYEDFGAMGDGKTDDMPAIVKAHEYANEKRLPVKAKDGAEYYIGGRDLTAIIKTSTYFGTAKFIIDDVKLENIKASVFKVVSDFEDYKIDVASVKAGQKKIDFPHEGTVYARVTAHNTKRVFIRKGLNMNNGAVPSEAFIVDPSGNILTDINWDYPEIASAFARCVDDEPIVIDGGIFTTIANQWICKYDSHARNISVTRSHVTVKNIKHYVTGELDHGAPYGGFISVGASFDVTLKDCLLTPHFTYMTESKIPGQMVSMGTYDLGFTYAISTKLINVTQTIDITDGRYWGLMGSNYCKDMTLVGCTISRFDAHCGVTNVTVSDCQLGYMGFNLIGFGKCKIENTTINAATFINLRSDYGSFFRGTLEIKNCTWRPRVTASHKLINALNTGDHDFGYPCMMPEIINIDGLYIDDSALATDCDCYKVFSSYDDNFSEGKPYAYITSRRVNAKNLKSASGKNVVLTDFPEQYKNSELVVD